MRITPIILAAGQGTRMKSDLPKVLHPVLGRPLVWHAVHTLKRVTNAKPVVVIGHGAESVKKVLGDSVQFAFQEQRLGTGHAVMQAVELLKGKTDYVLVSYADMPLLSTETFNRITETQLQHAGPISETRIGRHARGPDGCLELARADRAGLGRDSSSD